MLSALEHLHALAAWWAPATSIALQEKPQALHTIPHLAFTQCSLLSELLAGHLLSLCTQSR